MKNRNIFIGAGIVGFLVIGSWLGARLWSYYSIKRSVDSVRQAARVSPWPSIEAFSGEVTGWNTYANQELGFSIKYPDTWTVLAYKDYHNDWHAYFRPKEELSKSVGYVSLATYAAAAHLGELTEVDRDLYGEMGDVIIDNIPAKEVAGKSTVNGKLLWKVEFIKNNIGYMWGTTGWV